MTSLSKGKNYRTFKFKIKIAALIRVKYTLIGCKNDSLEKKKKKLASLG